MKKILSLSLLLAVSASLAAAQPRKPAPRPNQNAALENCKKSVEKNKKDIAAIYVDGLADKEISPEEEKEFQAADARVKELEKKLSDGGLTLPECAKLDGALRVEESKVKQMAADHKVGRAKRGKNLGRHKAMLARHKGMAKRKLSPKAAQRHKESEARISKLEARMKGRLSKKDHEELEKELDKEEDELKKVEAE